MSIFNDISKTAKHGYHEVDHAGHAVEQGLQQIQHEVQSGVLQVRHATEEGLLKLNHEVDGALKQAVEELLKELEKPLVDEVIRLLESALPDTVWLTFGPFTFTVSKLAGKMESIRKALNRPPTDLQGIKQFVEVLEPDDIEVALKIQVPGLDSLSIGATLIYLPSTFQERLHKIIEVV